MTGTPIPGKRPHELPDRLVKEHLVFAKAPNEEGVFYRYRRDCQGKNACRDNPSPHPNHRAMSGDSRGAHFTETGATVKRDRSRRT